MHKATLNPSVRPVLFEGCMHSGPAVTHHHIRGWEAFEELAPRGLRLPGTPLPGDHLPLTAGREHTPSGSEVEAIDLDDVVDLTGHRDAGLKVPAPADLVSERTPAHPG